MYVQLCSCVGEEFCPVYVEGDGPGSGCVLIAGNVVYVSFTGFFIKMFCVGEWLKLVYPFIQSTYQFTVCNRMSRKKGHFA